MTNKHIVMNKKALQRAQIKQKTDVFLPVSTVPIPSSGWVNAIRTALGMTLEQLAKKLGVSKQNIQRLEKSEQEKSITLKSLYELADAMDMKLVYGFVPKDGSIDALIDRKASRLAYEIVNRTSQSMLLEDQEISYERRQKSVEERKQEIIEKMPKSLWD